MRRRCCLNKRVKYGLGLLVTFLSVCLVKQCISDNMLREINSLWQIKLKNFLCFAVDENINIIKYVTREEEDFDLYKKLGQNISVFSYVATNEKSLRLNVYDPNAGGSRNIEGGRVANNNTNENSSRESNNFLENKDNSQKGNVNTSVNINNNKIEYTKEQLSDFNFVCNNFYVVTERANLLDTDLVYDEIMSVDNTIKGGNENPQILIYHTHSHEGFVDTQGTNTSNIVAVGAYLAEVLSKEYGYNVIHCTQSFDEVNGVFDRSKAYTYATPALEQILEQYPTVEVVLDIHRDGLKEGSDKLLTYINGKPTAQVMFFNGISRNKNGEIKYLYNKHRKENLALSFKMKLKAMELFPDFSRRNYVDAYQYNLHLRGNSMLIEVGAQNNTFEEAKNAMEPLAKLLDSVFKDE